MKAIIVLELLDGINLDNKKVSVYINGVKNAEGFLLKPIPEEDNSCSDDEFYEGENGT